MDNESQGYDKQKLYQVNIHHTNLGEVGDWGRPTSYVNQKILMINKSYLGTS